MKIGMFTDTYRPQINGVVTYVSSVSKELLRQKNKVEIFAPALEDYIDSDGYTHRLPAVKGLSSFDPDQRYMVPIPNKEFRRMLASQYDIIHAHTAGPVSVLGLEQAKTKGVPYVLTYHTLLTAYLHYIFNGKIVKPRMIEVATKIYSNLCDALIAPSQKIKDELTRYGVTKPVFVLPNSVDIEKFSHSSKGYLRKKYNITGKILLFVGRVAREKNVEFLIKSFRLIAQKDKETVLVIVGNGPEMESTKKLVNRFGLTAKVIFTGAVPMNEVNQVYADADIFTFASVSEVHPMVVLEAAVSGLPIVTVEDMAYKEAVKNGINGFQTRLDEQDYASAVLDLLENEAARKKFALASKKLGMTEFSIQNHVAKLIELYQAVIDNYHPSRINGALTQIAKLREMAKVAFSVNKLKSMLE